MVGLVLVSHSKKLAAAVREVVLQMTSRDFPVVVASGVGEHHAELGTDAVHISEVLQQMACPEGILVLMDLGSAVLSAQTALELIDAPGANRIRLCPAPLVEGAIAAAVCAQAGGTLDEAAREAERGLLAKQQQIEPESIAEAHSRPPASAIPQATAELTITLENPHGLHARPAAAFVQSVSRFACDCEVSNLTSGRGPVPARSLTSLALLQSRKGDRLKIVCTGNDCHAAVEAIRKVAAAGFGEKADTASTPSTVAKAASANVAALAGSDGVAIGPLVMLETAEVTDIAVPGTPAEELAKLTGAMKSASDAIRRGIGGSGEAKPGGSILNAQALILNDPVVMAKLRSALENDGLSAAAAWTKVTSELAAQYATLDDAYLRERATDIRDMGRRVLRQMAGDGAQRRIAFAVPSILFADELLPSEADVCDPATVLGVLTAKGSPTSHAAIILRTLSIPMVVGATGITRADIGKVVGIDGSTGEVWLEPDEQTIAKLQQRQETQRKRETDAAAARSQAAVTIDGTRIEVLANVGSVRDASAASENGAEGIGLLRTEFLFASRTEAPNEDEQLAALREVYARIGGPLIIRSLDVGADKPLPFLPHAQEHNPYLGVRGIRLSLQNTDLFLTHLRAILRSGEGRDLRVMFPMISLVEEAEQALELLQEAHRQLQQERTPHAWPVQRGAMIEVPSAALFSEELAGLLDFFSIGTNDLTQYTMAAERGNAGVSQFQDALHPAVLRLMKSVVDGAAKRERHVGVCGDAASDPLAAVVFAGLGIRSLSVRPRQVAETKALFRKLHVSELEVIAGEALSCYNAAAVHRIIGQYLHNAVPTYDDRFALAEASPGDQV